MYLDPKRSQDHIRQLTVPTLILESCKMSSPLNKTCRKRKNEETLIGYAQDVSEVKSNRSNTTNYVTMRIQTSPVKNVPSISVLSSETQDLRSQPNEDANQN